MPVFLKKREAQPQQKGGFIGKELDPVNRPGFPEERHMTFLPPDKDAGLVARYVGPKTRITERIQRGDAPINKLDEAAMFHDVAYHNLGRDYKAKRINRTELKNKIKKTDEKFIREAVEDKRNPVSAKVATKLMTIKKWAEDKDLLNLNVFSGGEYEQEDNIWPPCINLRIEAHSNDKNWFIHGISWVHLIDSIIKDIPDVHRVFKHDKTQGTGFLGLDLMELPVQQRINMCVKLINCK